MTKRRTERQWKAVRRLGLCIALCCFGLASYPAHAQVRRVEGVPGNVSGATISGRSGTASGSNAAGSTNNPFANDSTQADTSATKGLIYKIEEPDSVLRKKVFIFHHRPTHVWLDRVWNPTLDPTGVQYHDPLDALNGNYYLGKGSLGHPHTALFPTLADGLRARLQPDLYEGYAYTLENIDFYQTLTPFSMLSYGGSLADDHSLQVTHTQNIMPGWNAAFNYRLLNPEGVYTSSGALNHYLDATTNYFSSDSRLQASAAVIWQSFNIDENGGLSNDSIFVYHLQSNRAGIPVNLSNSGSLQRNLAAMVHASYSLTRQSDTYRHRDSLNVVSVNDSTVRTDTIDVVDTIPLRRPKVLNPGVVGFELQTDRQKRVFTDSTLWREQTALLFWTNDAYTGYRWHNPLKLTVGLQPRLLTAVIDGDTARNATWLNPFARAEVTLWRSTLTLESERFQNKWSARQADSRLAATLTIPFDSAGTTRLTLVAERQSRTPDWRAVYDCMAAGATTPPDNVDVDRFALRFKQKEWIDVVAGASHLNHNVWYDTAVQLHTAGSDLWLLQASLTLRLAAGPIHLDMQQLVQHSTDQEQMPVPLWASKNSLYADFTLVGRLLRMQVGFDVRYHTPYHAPLYDPATGLFLHQDELLTGGYLWGDAFVNIQVKRASAYIKAGHVNALWENPSRYFLLPHYPGTRFGVFWGLTWCFFD